MKHRSFTFLIIGFLAGIAYISACGGGTNTIAAMIGDAVDVSYNNATSGMSATNVQAAIDEAAANQTLVTTELLVGNWTGSFYSNDDSDGSVEYSLTFNADGTYSCSASEINLCAYSGGTYQIFGNNVILFCYNGNNYRAATVVYFRSTQMNFIYNGDDLAVMTKG